MSTGLKTVPADVRGYYRSIGTTFEAENAGSSKKTSMEVVGEYYDRQITHRTDLSAGFMNIGLWYSNTATIEQASENLMEKLIAGIPRRSGHILDVGCGLGGTTRHLCRYWKPEHVHGINITEKQIETAKRNAPGCTFTVMDAAAMTFEDGAFENIICVEAAFHFESRRAFLEKSFRVLKKGGTLALTDVLIDPKAGPLAPRSFLPCNLDIDTPEAYRSLLEQLGFRDIQVIDITDEGYKGWLRFHLATVNDLWIAGMIDFATLQEHLQGLYGFAAAARHNVMCFASN